MLCQDQTPEQIWTELNGQQFIQCGCLHPTSLPALVEFHC